MAAQQKQTTFDVNQIEIAKQVKRGVRFIQWANYWYNDEGNTEYVRYFNLQGDQIDEDDSGSQPYSLMQVLQPNYDYGVFVANLRLGTIQKVGEAYMSDPEYTEELIDGAETALAPDLEDSVVADFFDNDAPLINRLQWLGRRDMKYIQVATVTTDGKIAKLHYVRCYDNDGDPYLSLPEGFDQKDLERLAWDAGRQDSNAVFRLDCKTGVVERVGSLTLEVKETIDKKG